MRTTDSLGETPITYHRVHEDAAATSEYEALTFAMVEVVADDVAALVRAGVPVWSLGYGWDDDDGFTTLGTDDLWAFGPTGDADVVASWGPFHAALGDHPHRVYADDAGRVRIAPESAPEVDQPEPEPAMDVDVVMRDIIAKGIADGTSPFYIALDITEALSAAGVVILAPQDLAWGKCSMTESGQHELSTSMCVGCLEYDPS